MHVLKCPRLGRSEGCEHDKYIQHAHAQVGQTKGNHGPMGTEFKLSKHCFGGTFWNEKLSEIFECGH